MSAKLYSTRCIGAATKRRRAKSKQPERPSRRSSLFGCSAVRDGSVPTSTRCDRPPSAMAEASAGLSELPHGERDRQRLLRRLQPHFIAEPAGVRHCTSTRSIAGAKATRRGGATRPREEAPRTPGRRGELRLRLSRLRRLLAACSSYSCRTNHLVTNRAYSPHEIMPPTNALPGVGNRAVERATRR